MNNFFVSTIFEFLQIHLDCTLLSPSKQKKKEKKVTLELCKEHKS